MATGQQKSYDPKNRTITLVDGDDDLDFEYDDFKSPRAAMSCGHVVTPMSLTKWCRWLLDQGESRFVCPASKKGTDKRCDAEWPYKEVRKMALLTTEEMKYFEENLAHNAARDDRDTKSCPGCKSSVERKSLSNLCVRCIMCTVDKKKTYEFCWQCLREWKGPAPRSDRCENNDCLNNALATLKICPVITFDSVKEVNNCPSVRACPTCGIMVEHNRRGCKNISCIQCKVEFCFVCLKRTTECLELKKGCYFGPCASGVAPRQTSIPVWNRK
ncbi:probable E3 ubiquitin-protein ligase RNF144A-A isoform X1 [Centroberyx affinis]|uniref:probable E3 ubiquitin-protein ligase RNF144A-A isoform X1 n=1 Tax=Centroberyx affinis TaxID=166261 RepID=UPI003A5BA7ED